MDLQLWGVGQDALPLWGPPPPQCMGQLWCHGSARSQSGREPHVLSPVGHYCHTEPGAVWVSTWHFPARRLHRMWSMMGVVG